MGQLVALLIHPNKKSLRKTIGIRTDVRTDVRQYVFWQKRNKPPGLFFGPGVLGWLEISCWEVLMKIEKLVPCPEIGNRNIAPFPFFGKLLLTDYSEEENNLIGIFIEDVWSKKLKVAGIKTLFSFEHGIHLIVNADTERKVRKLLDTVQGVIVQELKEKGYIVQLV